MALEILRFLLPGHLRNPPFASFAEGNCFPGANVHSREKAPRSRWKCKKKNVPHPVRTALLRMGWISVSSATFCRRTQLCFSQTSLWPFRARPGKLCSVQINNAFTQSRLRFSSYNIMLTSSLQCSKKWTAPLLTKPTAALCLSVGIWNFPWGQVPISTV